ncbi:MAG: hypothetical protein AAFR36_22755 [Bacteroidota bacterium]
MWKRILAIASILGLLLVTYYFLRPYYRLPFDRLEVFAAIPKNAAVLLHLPTLRTDTLSKEEAALWHLDAKKVASRLDNIGLGDPLLWESWWLIPVQGDSPLSATYTFIGVAQSGLASAWDPINFGPSTATSAGHVFVDQASSSDPLYFARHHNLFIAGNFPFQVESVLAAAKGDIPAWTDDERFQQLRKAIDAMLKKDDQLQLVLNTASVASSLPTLWYDDTDLRFWQNYADWWAFDFQLYDSTCLVTTYCTPNQQDWIPNTTRAGWKWVPEVSELAFPVLGGTADTITNKLPIARRWLGEGAWNLRLSSPGGEQGGEIWVLPQGDTTAYRSFREEYLAPEQITDQHNYQLFQLQQLQRPDGLEFLTARRHWQPWFVEIPGALVVSVYREDLERFLDYQLVGGTLMQQPFFLDLFQHLQSSMRNTHQGFLRWGPLADQETNFLHLLFPGKNWATEGGAAFISAPLASGVQKGLAHIGTVPPQALPASIRWTLPLMSEEDLQLFPVIVHGEASAAHFLIQSQSGKVWLIDLEGTILWEQTALPPLLGPVWHWREPGGSLRWGATSLQGLYIWDAQGQNIPLPEMSSSPTAGLSVFSFDSRATPVLAYPNHNHELELRNSKGQLLDGWPAALSGPAKVDFPLVHWQTDNEDFIIANTQKEGWQIFNRTGSYQYSLPTVPEEMLGAPAYDFNALQPEQSRLLGAAASGKINVWDLEGNIIPVPLGRGPLDRWLYQDCWGDPRPDYMAQRGSLVHLFAFEGQAFAERWQQRFPVPPDTLLAAPPVGTLVMSESEQKIWLIDESGNIPSAFPLAGSGGAKLVPTSDNTYVLLTLLDGQIYAYDLILNKL